MLVVGGLSKSCGVVLYDGHTRSESHYRIQPNGYHDPKGEFLLAIGLEKVGVSKNP